MNKMRMMLVSGLGGVLMAAAGVASANCDWRAGAVDLDLCPAVRASIEAEAVDELADALAALEEAQDRVELAHAHTTIARAKLSDGRCEDALGAVLDALWVDPLSDGARQTLEQIATRCRVDFTLRSSLER